MREALQHALGQAIQQRRLALGLTQTEFALRIGTRRPVVTRVENGRHEINMGTLYRYAEGLRCRPSELVLAAEALTAPEPATEAAE